MTDAQVTEHLGRKSLAGTAFLKDAAFGDGVIEVDVACTGARSYPGIVFRIQRPGESERVYIRPHRAGPAGTRTRSSTCPRSTAWTAGSSTTGRASPPPQPSPTGRWLHLRIEVKGTQARVFVGEAAEPALLIHDLKHGHEQGHHRPQRAEGRLRLLLQLQLPDRRALKFAPPPRVDTPPGPHHRVAALPALQGLADRPGQRPARPRSCPPSPGRAVKSDPSGLVDISRTYGRLGPRTRRHPGQGGHPGGQGRDQKGTASATATRSRSF